jgi:hypothetical protein
LNEATKQMVGSAGAAAQKEPGRPTHQAPVSPHFTRPCVVLWSGCFLPSSTITIFPIAGGHPRANRM